MVCPCLCVFDFHVCVCVSYALVRDFLSLYMCFASVYSCVFLCVCSDVPIVVYMCVAYDVVCVWCLYVFL